MIDRKMYVILHDIRSAHNVGSIFRTADGAGVSKIFLTGYTPAPVDRFGRRVAEIDKTSLGATETVLWESCTDIKKLIDDLKKEGVSIVAVEQTPTAIDYREKRLWGDGAYIFGNETEGIKEEVWQKADHVLHIPMHGVKESLNVSTAAGIILFSAL